MGRRCGGYLGSGFQDDAVVQQFQHHFDVPLLGGQMQAVESILGEETAQTRPHTGPLPDTAFTQTLLSTD